MALSRLNIDYEAKTISELYKLLKSALIEEQIEKKNNSRKLTSIYEELSRRGRLDLYEDAVNSALSESMRIRELMEGAVVRNFRRFDAETKFDLVEKLERKISESERNAGNTEEMRKILETLGLKEKSFICEVTGESMVDANIFEGDILIVEPRKRIRSGELVVLRFNETVLVKRYKKNNDGEFLVSENSEYPIFKIDDENKYEILGAVTTVIHKVIS
ncbi:hypothetical protein D9V86_01805 [Bacteroidetes/Chlorobi group bacterium ChocPot_Mid]|jgi:SOS-response transcriptional repressor LexA|nr:MAG: hypothetical protein D9V86_01805 [Bacteroidetes/Chlorobi group bacterium ChocPot_Mid]